MILTWTPWTAFFTTEAKREMTKAKKEKLEDPDWNAMAAAGEIVSQLTLLGEKIKALAAESDAKTVMAKRQEPRVLKRGVLEIRTMSDSYIASFQDVPAHECAGISIPPRPGSQTRGVGADGYEAMHALAREMAKAEVLG